MKCEHALSQRFRIGNTRHKEWKPIWHSLGSRTITHPDIGIKMIKVYKIICVSLPIS